MEDRDGSGFDAAVIAIDGLVAADCGVLEPIGLLLGGEQLNILAQRALIALERENVIGLCVDDFLRNAALVADDPPKNESEDHD